MSTFLRDFDTLLDSILTDYRNQSWIDPESGQPIPEIDTSPGSLAFIKSACLASAIWGLHKRQDYIAAQIFPDTADLENLEHHFWVEGLVKKANESPADMLARLLEHIRRPPAGGNKYDWPRWALEVEGVTQAWCVPMGQGSGTVDVYILADTVDELPDQALIDDVRAYIDEVRNVTSKWYRVMAPTITNQDVDITVAGDVDAAIISGDIQAYMQGLDLAEPLTLARITDLAMNDDAATDVTINTPAANVVPAADELIRPGTITVTAA